MMAHDKADDAVTIHLAHDFLPFKTQLTIISKIMIFTNDRFSTHIFTLICVFMCV